MAQLPKTDNMMKYTSQLRPIDTSGSGDGSEPKMPIIVTNVLRAAQSTSIQRHLLIFSQVSQSRDNLTKALPNGSLNSSPPNAWTAYATKISRLDVGVTTSPDVVPARRRSVILSSSSDGGLGPIRNR